MIDEDREDRKTATRMANVEIGQRLREAVDGRLTFEQAANLAGVTPKTFSRWVNGHAGVDVASLLGLAPHLSVGLDYILTGANPPVVQALQTVPWKTGYEDSVAIELDDVEVSAGLGRHVDEQVRAESAWHFPRAWLQREFGNYKGLRLLKNVGDSMEPDIRDGEWLLVDHQRRPPPEGIYVVTLDGQLLVARVQLQGRYIVLKKSNPAYDPITIDQEDEGRSIRIVGQVRWAGKMMG